MGKALEAYGALRDEVKRRAAEVAAGNQIEIHYGDATCENAAGAQAVRQEFEKLIEATGRTDILLKRTGCTGRCSAEPIVGIFLPGQPLYKYQSVTPDKVRRIFNEHVQGGQVVLDYLLDKKTKYEYEHVVTFFENKNAPEGSTFDALACFERLLVSGGVREHTVRAFHCNSCGLFISHQQVPFYVMVYPEQALYMVSSEADLVEIIDVHIKQNLIVERLLEKEDNVFKRYLRLYGDVGFFNKQTRLTLRNSGIVDPESLEDYVLYDGFSAMARVLDGLTPQAVIDEVKVSGLRGRGGAGFPTGVKWQTGHDQKSDVKYLICNADEGDPGAFMDRSTLEGDPYSIIEGMVIGAWAIGAHKGFFYVRAEYPLAIERIEKALARCVERNLVGKDILGSGFDFELEIRLGAGAFVCGEETALIHSIEGKRGQPRTRPPFPAQSGLWGQPTVINNVETWANVPVVFQNGGAWFATMGTERSKGTKVFALAGKVKNTGLVEVPMGTSLRDIIYDIGGGIPGDHQIKAVQTGGPSGGCIPAHLLDTVVDYEKLGEIGSIMGSGGMIVLDEHSCMVDVARFFFDFTKSESCGKCTPCREGTMRILEILDRIADGQGTMADLDKLERLALLVKKASLCGLGQSAPNPVLSTLKYFRAEFETHVRDKRCPAKVCKKLIVYEIDKDKCVGCTACARNCPPMCIHGKPKEPHVIDQAACIRCGNCHTVCKFDAVRKG